MKFGGVKVLLIGMLILLLVMIVILIVGVNE